MKKLKVGFIAGFGKGNSEKGLEIFNTYILKLEEMSKKLNFELKSYKEIVTNVDQAINIRQDLIRNQVDIVLLFHASYIPGILVYELLKVNAPIGLWAINELGEIGSLPLGSMVSLEQNCSIALHNFLPKSKKFKWFFGDIDGKYFKERFVITVKILSVIKNLKNARVAQIGKLADGHINHMVGERQIYKNLGVDVTRDYEIEDIIEMSKKIPKKEFETEMNFINSNCILAQTSSVNVVKSIKMYLAIKKLCNENNYMAVALSCHPKLVTKEEIVGCLINSMLNSAGIVTGCEADVLSTISGLILNLISNKVIAVTDLAKFDEKDNSLLLWHCGSAPIEMANERGVILDKHFCWDSVANIKNCGPITDIIFRKSDVTVFRLTCESDYFYYFTGKFFNEKKPSFNGSRGWINDIKLYNEPISIMDLVNTILVNGLSHHFPFVLENISKYIEEFAFWMNLKKVKKIEYKDYLYIY